MQHKIIGITGRAGAGKDTVANLLMDHHGFQRLAMADKIKDGCAAMFGIERALFDDRDQKEVVIPWLGKSPRQLAQLAGTEFGRNLIADDVWLRVAGKGLVDGVRYVLPDVRFENEAAFVRAHGGVILHIIRPGTESGTSSAHSSENGIAMADGDRVVLNDEGLDSLLYKAMRVLLCGK